MTKRIEIIHGLLILALLGGAFYWFQWKPSEIRKKCAKSFSGGWYENCLNESGLVK